MLTELNLTNFKAWQSIDRMRLAPITGLFGTNSSGKSSILQFLLMLKQTVDSADRQQVLFLGEEKSEKSMVILGTFDDAIFKGAADKALSFSLSWEVEDDLKIENPEDPKGSPVLSGKQIAFSSHVRRDDSGAPVVDQMAYDFANNRFVMRQMKHLRKGALARYELAVEGGTFALNRIQGRPPEGFAPPIKCYGFPDSVRAAYKNAGVLSELEYGFEKQMQRIFYLGPLREYPFRDYRWSGAEPIDMGRRGEKFVPALLSAAQRKVRIGRGRGTTLEHRVAQWLKQLGLIHDFSVKEVNKANNLYEVRVRRSKHSASVLLPDVGFGVSQVLPVIVLCYYVPKGSTILLEQPEIHLHPMIQRGLADIFVDVATKRRVQVIFESHSEHLLRRLQRRVAERAIDDNQAALYFCDSQNGSSILKSLELDLYGNIRNWPSGFFGDEMEDILATAKAARERRASGGAAK